MDTPIEQLTKQQLSHRLLDAYAALRDSSAETEAIQTLKGELYRRGAERIEVVTIALAALIRQSLN